MRMSFDSDRNRPGARAGLQGSCDGCSFPGPGLPPAPRPDGGPGPEPVKGCPGLKFFMAAACRGRPVPVGSLNSTGKVFASSLHFTASHVTPNLRS